MLPMKTIIIEDEPLALQGLLKLLGAYPDLFEIAAVADNGPQALAAIEQHQPELIFLDIEIPVFNGFELLKKLQHQPLVVFTTAYDEYAVKAFEENSLDYLLKPIEQQRFDRTVERLRQQQAKPQDIVDLQNIVEVINGMRKEQQLHSLSVRSGSRILFIPLEEITHFFADERYVRLNTLDSKTHLTNYTIQQLEERLPPSFIRISRSVIIQSRHLLEAEKHFNGNYVLTLRDRKRSKVKTGRTYAQNIQALINGA